MASLSKSGTKLALTGMYSTNSTTHPTYSRKALGWTREATQQYWLSPMTSRVERAKECLPPSHSDLGIDHLLAWIDLRSGNRFCVLDWILEGRDAALEMFQSEGKLTAPGRGFERAEDG